MIQWAARGCSGIITVCEALKDVLVDLGVPAEKVAVLRNGVDLSLFSPINRGEARERLGLGKTGKVLLSVGGLIERKGHDIPIRALPELPGVKLLIVGDGELRHPLENLARDVGVADRVMFLGRLPQEKLPVYFNAADALVLASSREGWANVLLESMACGTPVIASNVWGTPEVVCDRVAGKLMPDRSPAGLVQAYRELITSYPDRADTRTFAEAYSWEETTRGQLDLMRTAIRDFAAENKG
jgi:glycosyltransferase involved in cell wall biosynthesis